MECINLPFTQYDSAYLESLPDEVFFAKRFKLNKEDEEILMNNSSIVHGRRFYRAKIRNSIMEKYAALTNPKEGEPGSKTNPLVRFGTEYVYNQYGDLVQFYRNTRVVISAKPSEEQKRMIMAVSSMPVVYDDDCPKLTPDILKRLRVHRNSRLQTMA